MRADVNRQVDLISKNKYLLEIYLMRRPSWFPDNFMLTLIGLIIVASFLPVRGQFAVLASWITNVAIALLFFLHGAKLSKDAVIRGISHLKLHGLVLTVTFLIFPLLGWVLQPVLVPLLGWDLYRGILYLCVLPSTVQSAIALTSLARGNIPAAICGAATSNILGIFISPTLVLLILGSASSGVNFGDAIAKVVIQLLFPFIAGQIARPWIGDWVDKNKSTLKHVDQLSIYLVIYTAFSKAVVDGIWQQLPAMKIILLIVFCLLLLGIVLGICLFFGRSLGLDKTDRITAMFGGAQKSLATGVPMAQVLFAGASMGTMILPLMIYHQVQLMTCAALARRFGQRKDIN